MNLALKFKHEEIDRAHRVGKPNSDGARALIVKTTFTLLRIGLKTAQKSNKTAFRLHSTGADLFENVTFAVATQPHFLNVVERKRSATRRCVNTNAVTFWYHL